jgi:hypothetical protein
MSVLNPGTRCVIVAGCPENIGLLVVVIERLGAYAGRDDAYRISTLSGRPFPQLNHGKRLVAGFSPEAITDRHKLRPLVEPGEEPGGSCAADKPSCEKEVEHV